MKMIAHNGVGINGDCKAFGEMKQPLRKPFFSVVIVSL